MHQGGYRLLGLWPLLVVALCVGFEVTILSQPGVGETYDLVLQGGRVIDPETGLDGIRNVGIRGDRIMEISERPLRGRDVLELGVGEGPEVSALLNEVEDWWLMGGCHAGRDDCLVELRRRHL